MRSGCILALNEGLKTLFGTTSSNTLSYKSNTNQLETLSTFIVYTSLSYIFCSNAFSLSHFTLKRNSSNFPEGVWSENIWLKIRTHWRKVARSDADQVYWRVLKACGRVLIDALDRHRDHYLRDIPIDTQWTLDWHLINSGMTVSWVSTN